MTEHGISKDLLGMFERYLYQPVLIEPLLDAVLETERVAGTRLEAAIWSWLQGHYSRPGDTFEFWANDLSYWEAGYQGNSPPGFELHPKRVEKGNCKPAYRACSNGPWAGYLRWARQIEQPLTDRGWSGVTTYRAVHGLARRGGLNLLVFAAMCCQYYVVNYKPPESNP